ncbi:MAG: DUF1990 family protein [Microbacteriaceae bacterium]
MTQNAADRNARALWAQPVSYAAVGATAAVDLMQHPPVGYRPIERAVRIGHGRERFEFAWTSALSWGIQKNSGFTIEEIVSPREVTESTYIPVGFDREGVPVEPALSTFTETIYGPDGEAFVQPGDTAILGVPFGPFRVRAPVRVVYLVDEPNRKGFAYGTLLGHPENGEESFVVEKRDDESVWLIITAFSRPASVWWWTVYPVLRLTQEVFTRRYERALAVPMNPHSQ